MIRGGHVDICVLGALQVSGEGDLANWSTGEPGAIPAVGGAMDLVAGVKTIFVIMQHTTKTGESKIVRHCSYPLTGKNVVSRIYSNLAIIDIKDKKLYVREMAPGVTYEYLAANTEAVLEPAEI
jgi:3-oxoadipate CoA-transferase beta subunit